MTTRRIVVGADGSEGGDAAVQWCREHAALLDAEVLAVFVIDLNPIIGMADPRGGASIDLGAYRRAMEGELERSTVPLREAGIPCRTIVREGSPAGVLDDVAREEDASLIVVGRRGAGGFVEMLLGSVPHALAHHASRPLVVVPRSRQ